MNVFCSVIIALFDVGHFSPSVVNSLFFLCRVVLVFSSKSDSKTMSEGMREGKTGRRREKEDELLKEGRQEKPRMMIICEGRQMTRIDSTQTKTRKDESIFVRTRTEREDTKGVFNNKGKMRKENI
jgi:hypothetical protein